MSSNPHDGFDSDGFSATGQGSEEFFLTSVNSGESRSDDTTGPSVSGHISEHGNEKSTEKCMQNNEPNSVPVHDEDKSGDSGKHNQHAMHSFADSQKATYGKMDTVKKHNKSSAGNDSISLAHGSDCIGDIATGSKLKSSLKDGYTEKFISEYKHEKCGKGLSKGMHSLIKGDYCDVFNHMDPTPTIVMPVYTKNKTIDSNGKIKVYIYTQVQVS